MSNKRKSGLADSPFFKQPQTVSSEYEPTPITTTIDENKLGSGAAAMLTDSSNDTTIPRYHDTVVSRDHDTTTPAIKATEIEVIRHAVKKVGREGGTLRFSEEEKNLINQAVFNYVRDHNIRTSGNEIARIAVNFIFQEYKKNGINSILHKVLVALHT